MNHEYCNRDLQHQLFVLALSKYLTIHGYLQFSNKKLKYLYMDKITEITESVLDKIKAEVAKTTLIFMGHGGGVLASL
jgi:fructose/tagatose bisphosphate aldolase